MNISDLAEIFTAVYTICSVLGHVLPADWKLTALLNRVALNLKK